MFGGSKEIICLRFNQEKDCFICSIEKLGVKIYNVEPLAELFHLDASVIGSIRICEMLNRTSIIALVAGGQCPKFSENTIMIWDDLQKAFVLEFTLPNRVLNVKLRKDRLIAVLECEIHIFSFPNKPTKLLTINTASNPRGICEVTPTPATESQVLVFPGFKPGSVQIQDLASSSPGTSSAPYTLNVHSSEVACITLNHEGTMLATASTKGTLLRIFDLNSKKEMMELRRGSEGANIHCLNFHKNSEFLCASSDRGTVHIFAIKDPLFNKRATFPGFGILPAYAKCQWGFANFTVQADNNCICAFGEHVSIYGICSDGTFHKYNFSTDGKCNKEGFDNFLELCIESDI